MRTAVPEKIQEIITDIDSQGNASLTRLKVLKNCFEHPGRLSVFGLWIARRAAGRKEKTKCEFCSFPNTSISQACDSRRKGR